jgi:D-arginine dehydrogenase
MQHDFAVVGAGMVGASIAYHLAPHSSVVVIEAETAPGYHSTGRSAALYAPSYGPQQIRALTRASRTFLQTPPDGFSAHPVLHPRGALMVAGVAQTRAAAELLERLQAEGAAARWLQGDEIRALVPVLRPEAAVVAVLDEEALDIDVDALLQGFLRGARASGAQLQLGARLSGARRLGSGWQLKLADGSDIQAGTLINAAGAWADEVAALAGAAPCRIQARRRAAFTFAPPPGLQTRDWPAVIDIDERWYFKPDAGQLLGSPANADDTHAHDVWPEELDIATGIHRIQEATLLEIPRPKATWAGLRSFAPDGEPVCGHDPVVPGFVWAAALGGYGIQTSPAFGRLCAATACGLPVPAELLAQGVEAARLRPGRDEG